jgi:hypothetical protein
MLLVITALAVAGFNAVGQGYFLFTANKNSVWDEFTTGTPISGGGHTVAGFLWGPAATVGVDFPIWNDPQFHWATNATANALVTQPVNASGLAVGGIGYLGGASFTVLGTTGGNIYTIYCVAWDSAYATPQQAGSHVGWSNPFQYASGNGPLSTPLGFSGSGMTAFGVLPEPGVFTLAGLAALALILHRRRRSKG